MVGLDGPWNVLLADKVGAEEHESIGWARNVAKGATLAGRTASLGGGLDGEIRGGKELVRGRDRFGGGRGVERGRLAEVDGGHIRREGDRSRGR